MSIKLYTVKCPVHGNVEVIAENSDPVPKQCPILNCYKPVSRVYDIPNVHYKGSGWANKDK